MFWKLIIFNIIACVIMQFLEPYILRQKRGSWIFFPSKTYFLLRYLIEIRPLWCVVTLFLKCQMMVKADVTELLTLITAHVFVERDWDCDGSSCVIVCLLMSQTRLRGARLVSLCVTVWSLSVNAALLTPTECVSFVTRACVTYLFPNNPDTVPSPDPVLSFFTFAWLKWI